MLQEVSDDVSLKPVINMGSSLSLFPLIWLSLVMLRVGYSWAFMLAEKKGWLKTVKDCMIWAEVFLSITKLLMLVLSHHTLTSSFHSLPLQDSFIIKPLLCFELILHVWKLSQPWPVCFLGLYKKSGTEIENEHILWCLSKPHDSRTWLFQN